MALRHHHEGRACRMLPQPTWDEFPDRREGRSSPQSPAPWGRHVRLATAWRSLAPITHSMSTDVYTSEGLFDFTSEPAIEALKADESRSWPFSNPDILLEGVSDAGVNSTPDEVAFAAQRVGLYFKYFSAPLLMAQSWDDPKLLHLGPLPKFTNGEGSTVFWTSGVRASSSMVKTRKRRPSTSRP